MLEVRHVTVGPLQEHCYVLTDQTTNHSIVIDPGAQPDQIMPLIGDSAVQMILLTHAHGDHTGAVEAIRTTTDAPVLIHAAELPSMDQIGVDQEIADDQTISLGAHLIRSIHTPGHTPGMITFMLDDGRAIVGDTIFEGGPGRTWNADNFRTTLDTLRNIVLMWPDDTVCYPGHGPSFRLGDVRDRIERFVGRDHPTEFYGDAEW